MHWRNPRRVRRCASGRTVAYNLRLPGQVFDGQAGLHQNDFRDYDPAVGRYAESDPIGLAGGTYSTYTYVANNPLWYIDPFGLDLTEAQLQAVIDAALDWSESSVPYKTGGASKSGADCSGAISGIYSAAGINIGRMTSSQFAHSPLFSPVTGPLQVGDVGVYPGHVAMYGGQLGSGVDVWSAFHTGGPVFGPANSLWFGKPTWYRYKPLPSSPVPSPSKASCGCGK